MAFNLVTAVQERLGFNSFDKIDPNVQQGKSELQQSTTTDHFMQAATATVLVGFYKYGSTSEGSQKLFLLNNSDDLIDAFFGDKEEEVISAVSHYGNQPYDDTYLLMQKIAQTVVEQTKQQVGENASPEKIRTFVAAQRHNILVYLPPDLRLGELVKDESIEDRTNKMEGPVSGLMHFIEHIFGTKDRGEVS